VKSQVSTPAAYDLFHQGTLALAEVELNGFRIDTEYLDKTIGSVGAEIDAIRKELIDSKVWSKWKRQFMDKAKLGNRNQLRSVFEAMGHIFKADRMGKVSQDASQLQNIDHPFIRSYERLEKLKKLKGTYLEGVRREVCDGFLHPSFNLAGGNADDEDRGGAKTYRSSSSGPNFQNLPIRDPEIGRLIRKAFIPREGHRIVEFDFKGIEVGIAACYNHDPVLIKYVSDSKNNDMHRDMAAQLFKVPPEFVSKKMRHAAKNQFVFPEFYGSFFVDCARDLWETAERGLKLEGCSREVLKHLAKYGIHELGACDPEQEAVEGTFEYHVKKVEEDFWGRRFKVYTQWKKQWYRDYLRTGGFRMHTGFYIGGDMRRNQVINYPVQGAAFHCLLWCLIRLQRWIRKNRMASCLIGQIHDSLIGDLHESEASEIMSKAREIMLVDLPRAWDWIIVPLEVEVEAAPVGASWFDKRAMEFVNGEWVLKE